MAKLEVIGRRLATRIVAKNDRSAMASKRMFLVRHGERADSAIPGWKDSAENPYDPPLTQRGLRQAQRLGFRLRKEGIQHIYCSPFLRTAQTADQVASILGLSVKVEPGLCESLLARLFDHAPNVLTPKELKEACLAGSIDTAYKSRWRMRFPEKDDQVFQRSAAVFKELSQRHPKETVLLVGHGLPLMCMAEAVAPDEYRRGDMTYCCLTECVSTNGKWKFGAFMEDNFLFEKQSSDEAQRQQLTWTS